MANKSKSTFKKMEKEKARKQKQKDKEVRRHQGKASQTISLSRVDNEDPDIAGIQPGPQPLPAQWDFLKEE